MSDDEYSDDQISVSSEDSVEVFSTKLVGKSNLPSFVKLANTTKGGASSKKVGDEDDDFEGDVDDELDDDVEGEDVDLEDGDVEGDDAEDEEDDDESDLEGGGDNDDGEDAQINTKKKTNKINKKNSSFQVSNSSINVLEGTGNKQALLPDFDTDDEDDEENYLQKFTADSNQNELMKFHPETVIHNYDEISALTKIVKDSNGIIIDPLHRTACYLTKFEKARVLGQRAKQIEYGAKPFIKVPENIIEASIIAELELQQKRIPFIIRRPLSNGTSEYWNLRDLDLQ
jgi:DNA-directed RNA polymerase subunit K/omega